MSNLNYEPIFDDKFEYVVDITWKGWKRVVIPFRKFKDVNRSVGDNIFNPHADEDSGGLLHYQMVFLASAKKGIVELGIGSIEFLKE